MLIDCAVSKVGLPPSTPSHLKHFIQAKPAREQLTFTTDPDWRSPNTTGPVSLPISVTNIPAPNYYMLLHSSNNYQRINS